MNNEQYWLVIIEGDVEPILFGAFYNKDIIRNTIKCIMRTKQYKREDDGLFLLTIGKDSYPKMESFVAGYIDEIEKEHIDELEREIERDKTDDKKV